MKEEDRKIVPKDWGYELWIVNSEKYCYKLLYLNKGAICSYHKHINKTESFWCYTGKVKLNINGKEIILLPKTTAITIEPGEFHKFEGLEKSLIMESSTHHDDKDVVRLEQSKKGRSSWKPL